MKFDTDPKFRGKNMRKLCRQSRRALKTFKRVRPEYKILDVSRQIYRNYTTLGIRYLDTKKNRIFWTNIFCEDYI